jgi:hypothetical protein
MAIACGCAMLDGSNRLAAVTGRFAKGKPAMFRRRLLEGGVGRRQMMSIPPPSATPGAAPGPGVTPGGGSIYIMRQHLFAFGDDFYINDAQNQRRFMIDGKVIWAEYTMLNSTIHRHSGASFRSW